MDLARKVSRYRDIQYGISTTPATTSRINAAKNSTTAESNLSITSPDHVETVA
jgi:hypothetical protein